MSKHTQGPWELFEHSWSDSSIYAGKDNEKCICRLSIHDEATEETQFALGIEMDANARLIVAAPTMLSALEFLMEQFSGPGLHPDQKDAIQSGFDAIAKATGKDAP